MADAEPLVLPVIPPRKTGPREIPLGSAEDAEEWYYVQSPREEHGAQGPFPVDELRVLKNGSGNSISDATLFWRPGLRNWQQLRTLPDLRQSLITLPPIPTRDGSENGSFEDPISATPNANLVEACKKLAASDQFSSWRYCSRCGSTADRVAEVGEQTPDLMLLRQPIGALKPSVEILPGFLWIGNSATGKAK